MVFQMRSVDSILTFQLAACLVEEMVAQCLLIVDNQVEVSDEALGLTSRVCELEVLRAKIRKESNKHPWSTLPGGASAALNRVTGGSSRFTSQLKPNKADHWTFPGVVSDSLCILEAC